MGTMFSRICAALASTTIGVCLATAAWSADNEPHLLGEIHFRNSGSVEAQTDFTQGVLYLHNFEYRQAAESFRNAQALDPDFAMAYWGEAMAFHQSLWNRQSRTEARDVLRRLGRTSEARAAKAGTQVERDFLHAAETLFGMTPESQRHTKYERDKLYRDALKEMHARYPDDNEVTAFYGLAILGVGSANREYSAYMRAAAVLTKVWDDNRKHPGAAHYLIHSYDDPVHAILGLPMARAYSEIAPAAAHAQHMTTHIFVALGMWDDVIAANARAISIEHPKLTDKVERSREACHYLYWLQYGYLQTNRQADAKRLLKDARARVDNNPSSRERAYYGAMYARYLLDSDDTEVASLAVEDVDIPSPHYYFARAYIAALRGDIGTANKLRAGVRVTAEGNPEVILSDAAVTVLQKELDACIALARGDSEAALALCTEAVEMENALPFRYGPPQITKPTSELLGDMMAKLGRHDEAIAAYEEQLAKTPLRAQSLAGIRIANGAT